jgi:polysaccharide deacetylase family protein (PEP-CTERM system associated)
MPLNYLTIDVEDYFQVSAFESVAPPDKWDTYEPRVSKNTIEILEILDVHSVKATFFVVGWIAEKNPHLVKEIAARGHEIGCHSYLHRKIYDVGPEIFKKDTRRAKHILEDLIGKPVLGYRAPTYSITKKSLWALDILEKLDFKYDSSIFPTRHDMYGFPDAPRFPFFWNLNGNKPQIIQHTRLTTRNSRPAIQSIQDSAFRTLREYPISTAKIFGQKIPIAGGGYFRLFPYWFTKRALRKINQREKQPFIFYLHPWEIDPDQPRFHHAGVLSRFRHYNNLHKTAGRFECLLRDFQFGPIPSD